MVWFHLKVVLPRVLMIGTRKNLKNSYNALATKWVNGLPNWTHSTPHKAWGGCHPAKTTKCENSHCLHCTGDVAGKLFMDQLDDSNPIQPRWFLMFPSGASKKFKVSSRVFRILTLFNNLKQMSSCLCNHLYQITHESTLLENHWDICLSDCHKNFLHLLYLHI